MSETLKAHNRRILDSFYFKYTLDRDGLDVGANGTGGETFSKYCNTLTILDIDYPGYDGVNFPFKDNTFDFVYSSHMLEHIENDKFCLNEHWRCVKPGGFIILYLPHQWLYEKKDNLPSQWNLDHKHFYTPARVLTLIESTFPIRKYHLEYCKDCYSNFDFTLPDNVHSTGEFSIETVINVLK